jgi:two-component system, sporulation sensor kinase E
MLKIQVKGLPNQTLKPFFSPVIQPKKEGGGWDLSLAKRIVENYHQRKIFIKWSEAGKGTVFRIILNK